MSRLGRRLDRIEQIQIDAQVKRMMAYVRSLPGMGDVEQLRANCTEMATYLVRHPHPEMPDGRLDVEPYLRWLADRFGLDPDDVLQEARSIAPVHGML